jgi:hypothetical protein
MINKEKKRKASMREKTAGEPNKQMQECNTICNYAKASPGHT